jgi:hypothetical protein
MLIMKSKPAISALMPGPMPLMAANFTAFTLDTSAPSSGSAAVMEVASNAEGHLLGPLSNDNIWRDASKVESADLGSEGQISSTPPFPCMLLLPPGKVLLPVLLMPEPLLLLLLPEPVASLLLPEPLVLLVLVLPQPPASLLLLLPPIWLLLLIASSGGPLVRLVLILLALTCWLNIPCC